MNLPEKAAGGLWGANILAICAANPNELRHGLSVLALYAATYFLFAPLHALIMMCAWTAYGAERTESPKAEGCALRAVVRVVCAETLMFWGLYWGMVLDIVPLHMRV